MGKKYAVGTHGCVAALMLLILCTGTCGQSGNQQPTQSSQQQQQTPTQQQQQQSRDENLTYEDDYEDHSDGIWQPPDYSYYFSPGDPETEGTAKSPHLTSIPETNFTCTDKVPGYYADDDPTSQCQAFHYCHHNGDKTSFLCPAFTIFNQKFFVCDYYQNFDCAIARQYYALNGQLYTVPDDRRRR